MCNFNISWQNGAKRNQTTIEWTTRLIFCFTLTSSTGYENEIVNHWPMNLLMLFWKRRGYITGDSFIIKWCVEQCTKKSFIDQVKSMGSKMDYHSYQDILIKGMSTQNSAGWGIDKYNRGTFFAENLVMGRARHIQANCLKFI